MASNARAGPSQYGQHHHSTSSSSTFHSTSATNSGVPPSPISPGRDEPPTHVQAIHDFSPASLTSASAAANPGMYLSFKNGEVIRVHARDPTGWWDGEIATKINDDVASENRTGPRRGWFPSNYVREMGHDGTLHRRVESSTKSDQSTSPRSRKTNMSISSMATSVHSRHTSAASHVSRASSSQSTSYAPSPTHRSMATLPPPLQNLLHPVVRALSILDGSIHSDKTAHVQPAAAYVISAIRAVLEQTDCLNKDSKVLGQHVMLGKERKGVLVELNRLVQAAKQASGAGPEDVERTPEEVTRDFELLAKSARSVFAGVKRFLQYANEYKIPVFPSEDDSEPTMMVARVLGPDTQIYTAYRGSEGYESGSMRGHRTRLSSNGANSTPGNSRIQETFKMRAASVGDLRAARRRGASSPPPPMPNTAGIVTKTSSTNLLSRETRETRTRSPSDASTPQSATFHSSSSGRSSPVSQRSSMQIRYGSIDSTSTNPNSPVMSTRTDSWDETMSTPAPPRNLDSSSFSTSVDVLEAISAAEDSLLSYIAAYIGHIHSHHLGSHASSHANLIVLTRETVDAVRILLTVVEAVGRDVGIRQARPREIDHLRATKDNFYTVALRLIEGTEIIGNAPFSETETNEEDYDAVKHQLLSTATATLRAGTECVRLVRLLVPEGSDTFATTPTPSYSDTMARQSTPRPPPKDAAVTLRDRVVGQRGAHTLSGLHRKASSLSLLHQKYRDGTSFSSTRESSETTDEEDEEVVDDAPKDDDMTLQPGLPLARPFAGNTSRPLLVHTHTSPSIGLTAPKSAELLRSFSDDLSVTPRSRSSSLTSPAPPQRMTHRSPSRSADLDKFTSDLEVPLANGAAQVVDLFRSADDSSLRSSGASDLTTPAPMTPHHNDHNLRTPELGHHGQFDDNARSSSTFNKFGGLKIDTDATPVKSLAPPRPYAPNRSATAPAPSANVDVRFWVIAHDYDPREITFNSEGTMVGASLTVLVEKMTPHDGPVELTFWATFFYTFRLFTTPAQLLEALITRYNLQAPPAMTFGERERGIWLESKVVPIRLRVYNFLKAWLDTYWRPDSDDVIMPSLQDFATQTVRRTLPAMAPRLEQAIRKRQSGPLSAGSGSDTRSFRRSSSSIDHTIRTPLSAFPPIHGALPPTPVISKSLNALLLKNPTSANVSITEFDALELARQLTIMESKLFSLLAPEDLLQTGRRTIPELKALSTLSNQITGWVADNILNEQDSKKRASLLKFYIKLADKCLRLNNFSTLFAVLAGLNSSTVSRLKKTWDALPTKYKLIWERLQTVIEHTKNHAAYRARLREAEAPCLPFLGLILTDITFTSDGNPDTRPSTLSPELQLINQDKYTKLGRIATEFVRYQTPFNFHELETVQMFLRRSLAERSKSSLDALYRKSLMLEPRVGSEKISSGFDKSSFVAWKTFVAA